MVEVVIAMSHGFLNIHLGTGVCEMILELKPIKGLIEVKLAMSGVDRNEAYRTLQEGNNNFSLIRT
jgi:hypothetical protein